MENLSENLFQAIDTIIAARINSLPYDFTKQCKVISIDEANKGIYRVNDGAASFEVYGEANAYQLEDIVRVSVPEGKMELDKFIVGKWLTRDDDIISSKSALESVIDLTGNIYNGNALSQLDYDCSLYNSVILTADITSTNMTEKYGINIIINKGNKNETILKLHSDHMIGDPANFNIPSPQEAVFILDAKTLPTIYSIEIEYVNETSAWTASNIHLALGNDATHLDKTIKIFTSDKLTYTYKEDNPERTLSLLWYNQDSTGKYIGYSDGEYDASDLNDEGEYIYDEINAVEQKANRYCIRWYKKDIMGTGDALIEKGWTFIENSLNVGLPKPQENEIKLPQNGNREFKVKLNTLGTTTETYVAILVYNHIKYRSNEIVFTNEVAGNLNEAISNGISNFKLQHGTNSKSLYDIYDFNTGKSLPGVTLTGKQLQVQWNKELEGGTIKWIVPESDTQLIIVDEQGFKETIIYQGSLELRELEKTITNENSLVLNYSLSDTYNMANTNNTVYCEVRPQNSNITYRAEQTFVFQPKGNNGTPYTFIATPINRRSSILTNQDGDIVELLLQLFDETGTDRSDELNSSNTQIKWLWGHYTVHMPGLILSLLPEDVEEKNFSNRILSIQNKWGILAIKTTVIDENKPLTIYCPIGCTTRELAEYWTGLPLTLKGPTRITYNAQGSLINSSNPYIDDNENKTFTWDIQGDTNFAWKNAEKEGINISPIYLNTMQTNPCYLEIKTSDNSNLYWPLVFIQDVYGSSLFNDWDNSLTLNSEGNYIMSAAMAAGSKEGGTFTGVVMGKIQENDNLLQGLFGYNSGSQTFGFKIDGTAFIGDSNGGRIWFDGNRATIEMGNVYINGLPDSNENENYLLVGTADNYLKLSADNKLSIQVNEFILDAYSIEYDYTQGKVIDETGGIYLNSNPDKAAPNWHLDNYYFKVGDNNNYLSFNANNEFALKVNELTLSAGLADNDPNNDFYLSNTTPYENRYSLIIGSNFSVDKQGNLITNSGSIGGITIDTNGLSTASFLSPTGSSFRATMKWNKTNSTVTVDNYDSTDDTIWKNTAYQFSKDIATVYITGWGASTEFFIMNQIPNANGSYSILEHKYSYELEDFYQVNVNQSNDWYIIINKKPTTIATPVFSSTPSNFTINRDGTINASNAQISGNIKATSITANKTSEIVGWSFKEDKLEGGQELRLNTPTGFISLRYDTADNLNQPVLEIHNGGGINDYKKIKLLDLG